MNNDEAKILSEGNEDNADRAKLLQALNDDLSFADDDLFELDATEGLQQLDEKNVPFIVDKLDADLHRQLRKKKKRRALADSSSTYITIITILLLIVVAYIVIKKLQ
jgi:hypothetical protein